MSAEAGVCPDGWGQIYLYGDHLHFQTQEEGDHLARIRAEELQCQKSVFSGRSTVSTLSPGYTFDLDGHYRGDYNQKYLLTRVSHQGSQAAYLTAGLQEALSRREEQPFYQNEFQALPADVQFRPERRTHSPKILGVFNAVVDAAGSGEYAELDEEGRYKVILPFDLSGRKGMKASAWIRMAQPYSGSDHGMHFPLHKGTEVLVSFLSGDPNRPIIMGAAPNINNPSVINSANASMSGFKTAGGNTIHMEDKAGSQRMVLSAGSGNSMIKLGRCSPVDELIVGSGGFLSSFSTKGINEVTDAFKRQYVKTKITSTTGGLDNPLLLNIVQTVLKFGGSFGGAFVNDLAKVGIDHGRESLKKALTESGEQIEKAEARKKCIEELEKKWRALRSQLHAIGAKLEQPQIEGPAQMALKTHIEMALALAKNFYQLSGCDPCKDLEGDGYLAGELGKVKKYRIPETIENELGRIERELSEGSEVDPAKMNDCLLDLVSKTVEDENRLKSIHEEIDSEIEEQKKDNEKTAKLVDDGLQAVEEFGSGAFTFVWGLIFKLINEKIEKTAKAKVLKNQLKISTFKNDDAKKNLKQIGFDVAHNKFAYSVIHEDGSTQVTQSSTRDDHFTDGMLFYTGKGDETHYAKEDYIVCANKRIEQYSLEDTAIWAKDDMTIASDSNLSTDSHKNTLVHAKDGLEIRTGDMPATYKVADKNLTINSQGKSNIKITASDNGDIDIKSNKKITISVGDSSIEIEKDQITISGKTFIDGQLYVSEKVTSGKRIYALEGISSDKDIACMDDITAKGKIKSTEVKET